MDSPVTIGGIQYTIMNNNNATRKTQKKKGIRKNKARLPRPNRMSGWQEDFALTDQFDKKNSMQGAKAVLPAMRPAKSRPRGAKAPPSRRTLKARLANYLQLVSSPFDAEVCKCPVNYNPVPSFMTSVARLTSTQDTLVVSANSCAQLAFWPGHNLNSDSDAMDGVSYHARLQNIGGNICSISPVPLASGAPGGWVNGVLSQPIAPGGAATNMASATNYPITFDQALPFSALAGAGDHTRWKLLSMGIRIQNVTPLASRAGDICSVQPSNTLILAGGSQRDYSKYPTFRISEAANTGTLEISWIPGPTDMAFWHNVTTSESPAGTLAEDIGLFVWVNNPSASAQNYKFQVIYHYELAGDSLVSISSPSILQPSDKSVIEPSLDVLRFTSGTASPFLKIAEAVAAGASPFVESAAKAVSAGAMKLLPEVASLGLSVFG